MGTVPKKINSQQKGDFLLRTTFILAVKLKEEHAAENDTDSDRNLAARKTVN